MSRVDTVVARFPELPRERVAQALAGDRTAIADLYRTYRSAVTQAVAAAVRQRRAVDADLDDLVSEVWTRFVADGCRRLHSYDPERGAFGYYLRMRAFATARALVEQQVRRGDVVRAESSPSSAIDDGFEHSVVRRDALARLWTALGERLGRSDLALFSSMFVEGHLAREVALALGLTEAAVHRRSQRLRQKLERIAADVAPDSRGARATPTRSSPGHDATGTHRRRLV